MRQIVNCAGDDTKRKGGEGGSRKMECEMSFKRLQQCMKLCLMARCKDSAPGGNAGCKEKGTAKGGGKNHLCKSGLEWKNNLRGGENPQW